ncbi:hypothetical protein OOK06_22515 [Streptomyces sp. NBC_00340]|uniref:hypothetical protein n=1 Tax=Streptomyces sp. NBC_00340 TaxID=2975716 RepID=UPI00225524D7|nr:hypothetical protein [Streptomyces sp. NBC_00340]MCX5134849.1 hypothetical protein [Streptomyces sp. NBC_00340]
MYDIDITVAVDAVGQWRATGRHANVLDAIQREGWDFLMEMDPHFSIAFPGEDRGGIMVRVVETGDGTLTLTEAPDWDSAWNDNRLLRLLAEHPGADLRVLRAVLDAVATKLAEGERPYVAVLALADRLELEADELRKLGTFQGASARLRHLLDLRLSARIRQTPPTA